MFTLLSLSALVAGVLGLLGIGVRNVFLIGFILGFLSVLFVRSRSSSPYSRVFLSLVAGGIVSSVLSFILYVLLKIVFVIAVVLIVLYFLGMLIHFIRRRGSW